MKQVDDLLVTALHKITDSVYKNVCTEKPLPDSYIVYNAETDTPELQAGDLDESWTHYKQVHIYSHNNPTERARLVRQSLRMSGFTIMEQTEIYDPEGFNHLIISVYMQSYVDE